jgi:hypothetical protein
LWWFAAVIVWVWFGVGRCVGSGSVLTKVVGGVFPDLVVDCGGFSLGGGGVLERRNLVCCRC